ncbi:MAG: dihydropteroate synthase [bacterium]|nr:dihydropteroate synthase [bacterium]
MVTDTDEKRFWRHRTGAWELGGRTLLMGIVNVTPDSFSDGGRWLDPARAVEHALELQEAGADILDFGAESTRPGSKAVAAEEQIKRLLPVIQRLGGSVSIPLSVDTSLSEVAEECLDTGASIVNDVTALRRDAHLAVVCARHQAGLVLMHMRGAPETMQRDTQYDDLFAEIRAALSFAVNEATGAGVARDRIVVDPGLGFGKSFEQNHRLLAGLHRFRDLAAGVLAGPSRKAFTAEFSGAPPEKRQFSTAAAVALAIVQGADIVRVHDVREMRDVADLVDRFREVRTRFHD